MKKLFIIFGLIGVSFQTAETNSYYILDRAKIKTNEGYIGITFLF